MTEMRKAILDAFFILDCMRKRIDFVEQLEEEGFKIAVLKESLQEIRDFKRQPGTHHEDKVLIDLMEPMLQEKNVEIKGRGQTSDKEWLIKKGNEGYYIGTKIKDVQHQLKKKILLEHDKVVVVG